MPRSTPVENQQELPFSLLDLKGKTVLSVKDVSDLLGCSTRHVCELIAAEQLCAINVGLGRSRMHARIPVESFRDFVMRGLTCLWEESPLRHLPDQSLIRFIAEARSQLAKKGIRV